MPDATQGSCPQPAENSPHDNHREQAVFLGWQRTRTGTVLALYNVTAEGHPYFGSTVSGDTLRRLKLDVPGTPPPVKNP